MRDLFKKAMTGSMIAGAALLVTACGGSEDATANNAAAGNYADETLMGNDLGTVDAVNGAGNLGVDANVTGGTTTGTTDLNTTTTTTTTTNGTDAATNTTTTGTGNTTGM